MTLKDLIAKAKQKPMSEAEKEEQRVSFAYGNAAFENAIITLATVSRESQLLRAQNDHREGQSS